MRLVAKLFLLTLAATAIALQSGPLVAQRYEKVFADAAIQLRGVGASNNVVIVRIDEQSLRQVGRWPWPRAVLAQLIDKIANSGATVIGLNVVISEPSSSVDDEALRKAISGRKVVLAALPIAESQDGSGLFSPTAFGHPLLARAGDRSVVGAQSIVGRQGGVPGPQPLSIEIASAFTRLTDDVPTDFVRMNFVGPQGTIPTLHSRTKCNTRGGRLPRVS